MAVPAGLAGKTSPSLGEGPPGVRTVARDRMRTSAAATEAPLASVTAPPSSVKDALVAATFDNVGASLMLVTLMVVVCAALRLNEPEPSLSVQVSVRVGFEPKSVGFSPAWKVTLL